MIKSWDRKPVTIIGSLENNFNYNTILKAYIKPNFIFILFPTISLFFTIAFIIITIIENTVEFIRGIIFGIILIVVMGLITKFNKTYYKTQFENSLDLEENNEIIKRTIRL